VQDIVALSGAHTLGRSRPERSGWGKPETKYTVLSSSITYCYTWNCKWIRTLWIYSSYYVFFFGIVERRTWSTRRTVMDTRVAEVW